MRAALVALVVVASLLAGQRPAAAHEGFHASWVEQSPYLVLGPGATGTVSVRFRNEGLETWRRGVAGKQVNLGIVGDSLAFADLASGWLSPNRPATTTEAVVPYGAIGTFTFTVRAPERLGVYDIRVRPVADGTSWLEDYGVFVRVTRDDGYHSRWLAQTPNPTLAPGETSGDITLRFRNTGGRDWVRGVPGEQVNLGIKNDDRTWASLAVGWLSPDRPASQNEARVRPGEDATFTFRVRAPRGSSTYVLALRPVVDGTAWLEDEGVFVALTVAGGARPLLRTEVVQDGLSHLSDLALAPDGQLFVADHSGVLRTYRSADPGASLVAMARVQGVHEEGDAGLTAVEVDPAYATNGYLYVCVSRDDEGQWREQVLRYRVVAGAPEFDGYVIRRGIVASATRVGCRLRFAPDGTLLVTIGDAGKGSRAQDPNSLNGKILRVSADGAVPADNPVLEGAIGRSEAIALGLRDPRDVAFEPDSARAFVVDAGGGSADEIDIVAAGANYGHPAYHGVVGKDGFTDPAWASGGTAPGVSGAAFAAGSAWDAWNGSLFVTTTQQSDLRRFEVFDGQARQMDVLLDGEYGALRSVRLAPDGSLYLVTDNGAGDKVLRITPARP